MTPVRTWDAWSDLLQTTRSMDRIFDEFFGEGGRSQQPAGQEAVPTRFLPLDIVETDAAYVLTASIPGVSPEAVEITFNEGVLTIHAKAEPVSVNGTWLRRERPYGSLIRRLQLPPQVEAGQVAADFENGVLTVTVPKTPKPEPVRIQVGGHSKQLEAAGN